MELDELKSIWSDYDRKLERSLQLNMQLLRKMNFDKVKQKSLSMLVIKLIEMAFFSALAVYMVEFTIKYFREPQFSITGILLSLVLVVAFINSVRQLSLAIQLRMSVDESITVLQKKTERLKLMIVSYVKYTLFLLPLYPVLLLIAGKIYLHVDFTEAKRAAYFYSNVAVAVILFLPLSLWLYRELSQKEITKPWVKSLFVGSGWFQAIAAQQFLTEIEAFEKE